MNCRSVSTFSAVAIEQASSIRHRYRRTKRSVIASRYRIRTMCSCPATASWYRSSQRYSRSMTAIRRPSSAIHCFRNRRTSEKRLLHYCGRRMRRAPCGCPSCPMSTAGVSKIRSRSSWFTDERLGDRWPDHATQGLRDQSAHPKTSRREFRLDQDGGELPQDALQRTGADADDLVPGRCGVQPAPHGQAAHRGRGLNEHEGAALLTARRDQGSRLTPKPSSSAACQGTLETSSQRIAESCESSNIIVIIMNL